MKNNPRTLNTDYDAWLKKFQWETGNKRKISVQANKKINEKFSNNLWEEKMNNLLESIKN